MQDSYYEIRPLCGRYVISRGVYDLLICNGLTTAETIVKLLDYDERGEVCGICYAEEKEKQ